MVNYGLIMVYMLVDNRGHVAQSRMHAVRVHWFCPLVNRGNATMGKWTKPLKPIGTLQEKHHLTTNQSASFIHA